MTDHLGFYINDIGRMIRKRFDGATRSLGVTGSQWRVLFLLRRRPGMNQGQIAEFLEVEPITTCRMVDRLEQAGMVERRRDPSDRRAWQIFLTDAATPVMIQLNDVAADVLAHGLKDFSMEEGDLLRSLLDRVRNNLIEEAATSASTSSEEPRHG